MKEMQFSVRSLASSVFVVEAAWTGRGRLGEGDVRGIMFVFALNDFENF